MAYHFDIHDRALVVDGFQQGIADDPFSGISDMRNIDVISVPGEGSVAMATQAMQTQGAITNAVVTFNAAGYYVNYSGSPAVELNTAVTFSNSGGALPTGLSATTAYYVVAIGTGNFQVSTNAGGSVTSFSSAGTGTNSFSTIQMATPINFTTNLTTFASSYSFTYFLQDSVGRIWVYNGSNLNFTNTKKWIYMSSALAENLLPNSANGLIAYNNYLFAFTANAINVISISDYTVTSVGTPSLAWLTNIANWNFTWQTILTSTIGSISHQAIISQNDSEMYFCNAQNIGKVNLIAGSLASKYYSPFNIANTHTNATGVTTSGSASISTTTAFFQNTDVGAVIVGTGIPTGAVIAQVISSTSATLSQQTASATGSSITFTITSAYDYSGTILPLPTNEIATCLTELGNDILIGGINNYIYPWDRISTNYSQPIFLAENHTYYMVTVNTNTYAFVGERGRIWVTNGSQAQLWKKIPDHISGTVNPFYTWTGAVFNRNQLYFGFQVTDNQGNTINQYGGLWAIDIDTQALRLLNQLSYGTYSGYLSGLCVNKGDSIIVAQTSIGYGLFLGWYNGTVGGIDKQVSTPYTGSQAQITSELIPIGTFNMPRNFDRLEYRLTRPLVSGESITIYARLIFNTSDTGFGTAILTDSTVGNYSNSAPVNFLNTQWIQLQAVLNSTATTPSYVRLKEFRLTGLQGTGPLQQISI